MPPAAARWSSSRTWISRSIDSRLRRRSPSPPTRAGTVVDLNASANNALNTAAALAGVQTVAAQFTFGGRTYLAINLVNAGFLDSDDLLIDITGFTGSIGNGNFV
jgi:hypothetical protein